MKKIILIIALIISAGVKAQDDKTVTLVVSGQGKTQDEAKQNALRSAIEQAFGAFISSKTEILNDELIKDEITSLSNGNVKSFEILSSTEISPEIQIVTLKAEVSLNKIASFVQSKGYSEVGFNGGGFTMNLKLQKLNEEAEKKAIINLCEQGLEANKRFVDYELQVGSPTVINDNQNFQVKLQKLNGKIGINFNVNLKLNVNRLNFEKYFLKTLLAISMNSNEIETYKSINKSVYIMHVMNQLLTDSSKNILPLHQKVRDRYYDSRSTGNISGLSMQKQDEISKQIKIQAQIEAQKFYTLDNILSFRNEESIQFLKSYFFASNIMPLFNFRIEHETGNFELKKTKKDTSGFFLEGNTSYNQFNCWHDNVGDDLMPILPYTATNFLGQSDEPYLYRVSRYSPSLNRHYLESFLTNIIYQMENDSKRDWVNPNRCDFISNFNDTNNLGKLFNSLEFFKKFKNNYFNLFSETDKDLYYIKPYLQDNYMKLNITVSFTDEELSHINSFRLKQIEQ